MAALHEHFVSKSTDPTLDRRERCSFEVSHAMCYLLFLCDAIYIVIIVNSAPVSCYADFALRSAHWVIVFRTPKMYTVPGPPILYFNHCIAQGISASIRRPVNE